MGMRFMESANVKSMPNSIQIEEEFGERTGAEACAFLKISPIESRKRSDRKSRRFCFPCNLQLNFTEKGTDSGVK